METGSEPLLGITRCKGWIESIELGVDEAIVQASRAFKICRATEYLVHVASKFWKDLLVSLLFLPDASAFSAGTLEIPNGLVSVLFGRRLTDWEFKRRVRLFISLFPFNLPGMPKSISKQVDNGTFEYWFGLSLTPKHLGIS